MSPSSYDLCLAWNWEHDGAFVALLEGACRARQLSLLQLVPANIEEQRAALAAGAVTFRAYLDRAS